MSTARIESAGTLELAGIITEPELSSQKLRSLRVLSPQVVDRICDEGSRVKFLIDGFLPCKSIAIFAGDSTIGKSPLVHQLALSVASGSPFLGMSTTKKRVLYLDLENSLHDCKAMRDAQVKFLNLSEIPDGLLLRIEPCNSGVLENLIAEIRPGLVVIDSIRSFRPEVTKDNPSAGAWLQEIRSLGRKFDCSFVLVHHLRKGRSLPDGSPTRWGLDMVPVSEWLEDMEGPRALVNQTDVRVAVDRGSGDTALEIKWTRRLHGDSPLVILERVFDDDGEPAGYRQMIGIALLSGDRQEAFKRLPNEFSFKDARMALNKSDDPTNKFLKAAIQVGILEKVKKGLYRKVAPSEHDQGAEMRKHGVDRESHQSEVFQSVNPLPTNQVLLECLEQKANEPTPPPTLAHSTTAGER